MQLLLLLLLLLLSLLCYEPLLLLALRRYGTQGRLFFSCVSLMLSFYHAKGKPCCLRYRAIFASVLKMTASRDLLYGALKEQAFRPYNSTGKRLTNF